MSGGVGIAKTLNVGGVTKITDTTNSTSTTNGALVVSGGVGVSGTISASLLKLGSNSIGAFTIGAKMVNSTYCAGLRCVVTYGGTQSSEVGVISPSYEVFSSSSTAKSFYIKDVGGSYIISSSSNINNYNSISKSGSSITFLLMPVASKSSAPELHFGYGLDGTYSPISQALKFGILTITHVSEYDMRLALVNLIYMTSDSNSTLSRTYESYTLEGNNDVFLMSLKYLKAILL